jgi:hypothetical protein
LRLLRLPRGLPVRAEALAVRRSTDKQSEDCLFRLRAAFAEALALHPAKSSAEALGPPDERGTEIPHPP